MTDQIADTNESKTTTLSTGQIADKIIHARSEIAELEDEGQDLALDAVSGDKKSIARIAEIRSTITRIEADISLLENARRVAQRNDALADREKLQDYRARHFQTAKERAAALVALADIVDGLVGDLKSRIKNIRILEREIWSELREAGAPPERHIIGRSGLEVYAIDDVTMFVKGLDQYKKSRPVSEIARTAWGYLLVDPDEDADE